MMVVLYFSCNFDVAVQGEEPCLPMQPSCSKVIISLNIIIIFKFFISHLDFKYSCLIIVFVCVYLALISRISVDGLSPFHSVSVLGVCLLLLFGIYSYIF